MLDNDSKLQTNLLPRRRFLQSFCLLPSLALMACARQDLAQQDLTSNLALNTHQANQTIQTDEIQSYLQQKLDQILPKWEADLNAKIGMAVIANLSDKPSLAQYRGDQRFPVNSTIKAFLAVHFLAQVDQDLASLDKKITLRKADLLAYAPVCKRYFAENKPITCQELCFAMLTMSDNTAANLILAETGGLPAFNRFLAKWVKNTHIAHDEPNINHAQYGDLLDTTPPSDYLMGFYHLLTRAVLSPKAKQQLLAMMKQNQVADDLFRKTLPKDWQIADRTGAGDHGSRSIIAFVWDQVGNQHLIALFITATEASFDRRNQAIAEIGEQIFTLIQDLKPQNLKQQNLIS